MASAPLFPCGIKDNYYRLRVGSYRVIFKKEEKKLIIIIVRIGHRIKISRNKNI